MERTVACACGQVFRGSEEALYSLIRNHIDPLHPERHYPLRIQQPTTPHHRVRPILGAGRRPARVAVVH